MTGVIVRALDANGSVLREVQVRLHERTSLSVYVPAGTCTLVLEGTSQTSRTRVELGPERRVLPAPALRRWRRRR